MSNLLKNFSISAPNAEKRLIDCNAIISEKLLEIRRNMGESNFSGDGFSAGLNPVQVSQVLEEGNQIIGEEQSAEAFEALERENIKRSENIIADAQKEADEIVNRANFDAAAIIANAQAEAERIRSEAKSSGYAEGIATAGEEAKKTVQQAKEEFELQKTQLISEYRKKEEELEPVLVDTILKIFAEITGVVSVDKKDIILTLVNNVMSHGESNKNFIIKACNEDAHFLMANMDKIEGAVREDIHIEIVADSSMKRNECIIDTDTGVYDCGLDIQMANLINDIRILSCTGE